MRKYTEIFIAILFIVFVIVMFMINNHQKEKDEIRTTSSSSSSVVKTNVPVEKTPQEIMQRKSEILKEIDTINKQIANTINQQEIDELAAQKKKLQEEHLELER